MLFYLSLIPITRPGPLQMFGQDGHYLDLRFFSLSTIGICMDFSGSCSCQAVGTSVWGSVRCEQQKCQEISPLSRRKPVQAGLQITALIFSFTEPVFLWRTSWDNRHVGHSWPLHIHKAKVKRLHGLQIRGNPNAIYSNLATTHPKWLHYFLPLCPK